MTRPRILLVDDNEQLREMMRVTLQDNDCDVVSSPNVTDAISKIVSQPFDVLITDLHMPQPGDGFAVVTAMRHAQPEALTLVVSGFPDVKEAMADILLQADEVLVKPFEVKTLARRICERTENPRHSAKPGREGLASILEREASVTVQRWLLRVQQQQGLTAIRITEEERTAHLPKILSNIVTRLRHVRVIEAPAQPSAAAVAHGRIRYRQGYTAPQIVQESRILQVCIFETVQLNLNSVDFSVVMPEIMLIADEVDSQLEQSIDSFISVQGEGAA
jgi:DNA-binding response OmpR family regulator